MLVYLQNDHPNFEIAEPISTRVKAIRRSSNMAWSQVYFLSFLLFFFKYAQQMQSFPQVPACYSLEGQIKYGFFCHQVVSFSATVLAWLSSSEVQAKLRGKHACIVQPSCVGWLIVIWECLFDPNVSALQCFVFHAELTSWRKVHVILAASQVARYRALFNLVCVLNDGRMRMSVCSPGVILTVFCFLTCRTDVMKNNEEQSISKL